MQSLSRPLPRSDSSWLRGGLSRGSPRATYRIDPIDDLLQNDRFRTHPLTLFEIAVAFFRFEHHLFSMFSNEPWIPDTAFRLRFQVSTRMDSRLSRRRNSVESSEPFAAYSVASCPPNAETHPVSVTSPFQIQNCDGARGTWQQQLAKSGTCRSLSAVLLLSSRYQPGAPSYKISEDTPKVKWITVQLGNECCYLDVEILKRIYVLLQKFLTYSTMTMIL